MGRRITYGDDWVGLANRLVRSGRSLLRLRRQVCRARLNPSSFLEFMSAESIVCLGKISNLLYSVLVYVLGTSVSTFVGL